MGNDRNITLSKEIEIPPAPGHPFLWLIKLAFWPLLFCLGPTVYYGDRKVPKKGGLIILANHLSDIDPVLVQGACRRPIYFMGKSELFAMKFVGGFMRWWGGFAVKRGEPDRAALKIAANIAKSGKAVGIFPEGQLSEDGKLRELKPGVALIVRMAGVPVICCGLRNTNRIIPYGSMIPRVAFASVTARWGEPKQFGPEATNEEIMAWAEAELRRLIPEQPALSSPSAPSLPAEDRTDTDQSGR